MFSGTRHDAHIFLKRGGGGLLGCVVFGLAACGLVGGAVLRLLLFLGAVFVHLSLLRSQPRQRLANTELFDLVSDVVTHITRYARTDSRGWGSFDLFVLVNDVQVLCSGWMEHTKTC